MARQHYFYSVMRKTIVQFLDLFNDIVIARYNPDTGAVIKYVKVPLRFAPKTKQWYWAELRENADRRDTVLPMMAVNLESVEYANDRQVNRNYKVTAKNQGDEVKQYFNPVPYDYTFSLQIAAEYMVDITQIVEQIFPFFTPETYIRITIPELKIDGSSTDGEAGAEKLELRVVYESASKESPVELDEAGFRILVWTLTFKVQGYLFSPLYEGKTVHNVVQNWYLTKESFDKSGQDVGLTIGDIGNQTFQGNTRATYIPAPDEPVDDDIRNMYTYERYEE